MLARTHKHSAAVLATTRPAAMSAAMIDEVLDGMFDGLGLPPLVVIFMYPTFVHFMYALIWNFPGVWFPSLAPDTRVRLFALQAYAKQVAFFGLLPW